MSKLTDEQIDNLYINGTKHWIGKREIARAIEAAATEPLLQRIAEFVAALDEEMVVSHLGVFNPGDDPKKAIKDLMLWSQGVGEYFAGEKAKERIAELEKALKLVQQHHATAWNRGHIAGMAANQKVAQDALNAVKKDAWNNTQLTEALMAAEGRCEELEQRNRDLYEDVQRFKKHALNEKAARMELERQLEEARKDAERYRCLRLKIYIDPKELILRVRDLYLTSGTTVPEMLDNAIEAAMQKGQS